MAIVAEYNPKDTSAGNYSGALWYPGGQYFQWDPGIITQRCYVVMFAEQSPTATKFYDIQTISFKEADYVGLDVQVPNLLTAFVDRRNYEEAVRLKPIVLAGVRG